MTDTPRPGERRWALRRWASGFYYTGSSDDAKLWSDDPADAHKWFTLPSNYHGHPGQDPRSDDDQRYTLPVLLEWRETEEWEPVEGPYLVRMDGYALRQGSYTVELPTLTGSWHIVSDPWGESEAIQGGDMVDGGPKGSVRPQIQVEDQAPECSEVPKSSLTSPLRRLKGAIDMLLRQKGSAPPTDFEIGVLTELDKLIAEEAP